MKQEETFWQAFVLLLVCTVAVGIYGLLAVGVIRMRQSGQATAVATPLLAGEPLQIVEPLNDAILQGGRPISVSAVLAEPGAIRAELEIDGRTVAVAVNPRLETAPWLVSFTWGDVAQGSHTLGVHAYGTGGKLADSAPVVATIVPPGQLAFSSNRDGAYGIYTMPTNGHDRVRLTAGRQPSWRVDGGLAYVAEAETGQQTIKVLPIAATTAKGVDLALGQDPAWASAGTEFAYAAPVDGVSQVFVATVGGLVSLQLTKEEVYAGQPTWAPDGTRLAYVAEREGNWDIWITDLKGSEPWRLTDDPGMDWAPTWSPDGSRLAFVSNRAGNHQIYVIKSDGSEPRSLTAFPQGAESPCWSPDGNWLAFVAYTGEGAGVNARDLWLMRADGRDQVRLTRDSFDDTEPDWTSAP